MADVQGRYPELSVLTLNCWGIALLTPNRRQRVGALGAFIQSQSGSQLDLVLLQEVWVSADAAFLQECGQAAGLPFSVLFKSGLFGSGLLTLSRYPIEDFGFQQFAAAGNPAAICLGDYFAKTGVGWVRICLPDGSLVDVYNTHLHANYSHTAAKAKCGQWRVPDDEFAPFRLAQIIQLAQVIQNVSNRGQIMSILGGDLNTKPDFLEFGLLRLLLPDQVDAWSEVHGHDLSLGHTTSETNSKVTERIDYILTNLCPMTCDVTLRACPDGRIYSDHFAVQGVMAKEAGTTQLQAPPTPSSLQPAAPVFTPEQLQENFEAAQAMMRCSSAILAEGVQRMRREAAKRHLLTVVCFVASLSYGLWTTAGQEPSTSDWICQRILCLAGPALAFASALLLVMGLLGDLPQVQALQACADRTNLLIGNMEMVHRALLSRG